jgi:hypothetical protein
MHLPINFKELSFWTEIKIHPEFLKDEKAEAQVEPKWSPSSLFRY